MIIKDEQHEEWFLAPDVVVCYIKKREYGYTLKFPNGKTFDVVSVGGILRCKGYTFIGYSLPEPIDTRRCLSKDPVAFKSEDGSISPDIYNSCIYGITPLQADMTVWRRKPESEKSADKSTTYTIERETPKTDTKLRRSMGCKWLKDMIIQRVKDIKSKL